MKFRLRPVLTVLLLLIFALENVVSATSFEDLQSHTSEVHALVVQEIHLLWPLLIEENEERDHKDGCLVTEGLSSPSFSPRIRFLSLAVAKKDGAVGVRIQSHTLPLYTYYCSFII